MNILALDLGERHIGVAVSDREENFARGICVVDRNGREAERIAQIAQQYHVEKIVYGVPLRNDGSLAPSAAKLLCLVDTLKTLLSVEFVPWDERYTTMEAEHILVSANLSRHKRRRLRDKLAAQIILQSYLDAKRPSSLEFL